MARVEHGDWPERDLKMMMDGFLTRENERELFGLDSEQDKEIRKPKKQTAQTQAKKRALKSPATVGGGSDDHFKL